MDSTRNLNTDIFTRKVSQRLLRILDRIEVVARSNDRDSVGLNSLHTKPPAFKSWREEVLSKATTHGRNTLQSYDQVRMAINRSREELLDKYRVSVRQHAMAKAIFLGQPTPVMEGTGTDIQGQPGYLHFPAQEKIHSEIFSCVVEAVSKAS
jgi:hypothetical protein